MPQYQPITSPWVLPAKQLGELQVSTLANFVVGAVLTGGTSAATAIIEQLRERTTINGASGHYLIVRKINGKFVDGETVTGVGGGTAVIQTNGFNLSITSMGLTKTIYGPGGRVRVEVLRALKNQAFEIADLLDGLLFPTDGVGALSHTSGQVFSTGNVLTVTVTSADSVVFADAAFIVLTIGANARNATYAGRTKVGNNWVYSFTYTVVSGDCSATAGANVITVGTSITGSITEINNESVLKAAIVNTTLSSATAVVASVNESVITIGTQPTDSTRSTGTAGSFTIAATVAPSATLTYLWEKQVNGIGVWTAASGGVYSGNTTATLAITSVTGLNTYKFRCTVGSALAVSAVSFAATLTVV